MPEPVRREALAGTTCIACGVFRSFLDELRQQGRFSLPTEYLPPHLHLYPLRLEELLTTQLNRQREHQHNVLLLYGDCCPHMTQLVDFAWGWRTPGTNCAQIVLGHDEWRRLVRAGAFFLFADWARNWHNIMTHIPGTDPQTFIAIFREQHQRFIYLDPGTEAIPERDLDDCARHFGVPWERRAISLDPLATQLQAGIDHVVKRGNRR